MNDHNVFIGLEIADHELRMVVGQFLNARLNVLKVERVLISGMQNHTIIDQHVIVERIKQAIEHVKETLGLDVLRVILSLPSIQMHRYVERMNISTQGTIGLVDIQKVVKDAFNVVIPEDEILVNVAMSRFIVNGITMRRLPLNEVCDSFSVDVDLYCGDKASIYKIVETVEKAGLSVSDISFDSFALGKEASLFEKSLETYQCAIRLERQSTCLSLFAKGKLISSEWIPMGTDEMIAALADNVHLPLDIADRLIHNNIRIGLDSYPETPIYLWSNEGKTHTLSEADAINIIRPHLEAWMAKLKLTLKPILENKTTQLVLFGESGEINGLDQFVSQHLESDCILYIPETLGVRSSALASVTGLFYVLKDQMMIRHYLPGVDMVSFNQSFDLKGEAQQEDTLSGRFKGLLHKR